MVVGRCVDASPSLDGLLGKVIMPLGEHAEAAGGATDAWAVLDRYQSSYFWSAQRVRWWWSRAVLTRLLISAVARRFLVTCRWGSSGGGT
jgi:hypothetical protein